jgi:hypothetical protein
MMDSGGCLALWRAVLAQVLIDMYSTPRTSEALMWKRDAIDFMTRRHRDVEMFCNIADIDFNYFMTKHRRPYFAQKMKGDVFKRKRIKLVKNC